MNEGVHRIGGGIIAIDDIPWLISVLGGVTIV